MRPAVALAFALTASSAFAQAPSDRVSAAGYYRIMTRPDFMGGYGELGFWNLYGRLLNEGPFAALELKLDLIQAPAGSTDPWASIVARIEGGSIANADGSNGSFQLFRLAQLYARAGNLFFKNVTWQLGTLRYYYGDLGLYDMRPATLFDETIGLSGTWKSDWVDVLLGVGDSGFGVRSTQYVPILTLGGGVRVHGGSHFELGLGGQYRYEPFIAGDQLSSYVTPNVNYEDFVRKQVVQKYIENNPGQANLFPRPVQAKVPNSSWSAVGYLGFGNLGPLVWSSFFINYSRLHPLNYYSETYQGQTFNIYTADLTRDRYQLQLGNEMQFTLVPGRLDAAWAVLFGDDSNTANKIQAGEDNRTYYSTVLRVQAYLTKTVHLLVESSLAQEKSKNGNLYRNHFDSIFASSGGVADSQGLEYGDSNVRNTWQGKIGFVLNPSGTGIYARPSIRLLYGVQWSSAQAAFGNGFVDSLSQFNNFPSAEIHWHHLISLESEGWF